MKSLSAKAARVLDKPPPRGRPVAWLISSRVKPEWRVANKRTTFLLSSGLLKIAAKYSILYSAEIMLFYTLSARYRLLFIAALLPSLTITMPTEQTLVRCWLAVSKSIAAKSFIELSIYVFILGTKIRFFRLNHPKSIRFKKVLG